MRQLVRPFLTLASAAVALGLLWFTLGDAQTPERVIRITAHKFAYEPNEIQLKLGEPVVLELTSKDGVIDYASSLRRAVSRTP